MHITPAFLARLPTSLFPTHPTRAQFVLTGSCCHVQGLVTDARCQWWMPPRGLWGREVTVHSELAAGSTDTRAADQMTPHSFPKRRKGGA